MDAPLCPRQKARKKWIALLLMILSCALVVGSLVCLFEGKSIFGRLWIALTPLGLWFLAMSFLAWEEARVRPQPPTGPISHAR